MSNEFITDVDELIRILGLSGSVRSDVNYGLGYPLLVPRDFVNLMENGNPCDPLLMQVLPRTAESNIIAGFTNNPLDEKINDEKINTGLPILKKYCGRALLMLTRQCGIHCRFCFRRHILQYAAPQHDLQLPTETELGADIVASLDLIMSDKNINEVIISGGDPLVQDDEKIKKVLDYIEKIPHVKRLRIHSRYPVIMPKRITERLNSVLKRKKPVYLVLHVNHPNELSENFLARLKILNAPVLLSQTVLLRGINDNVEVLSELFEKLADNRVIPYYLHQLDRVTGAAHFEVNIVDGCKIVTSLRERLSGYAIPRYVQEIAGGNCKKLLL
ncbi:MAG: KamA family radical SAM protein [Planctomycetaceae bacterium]|jgi:EF-P beta-lysylation protein EpmB|nr:KamA family radical SAM protein [Planctomycetaceae bacterium]